MTSPAVTDARSPADAPKFGGFFIDGRPLGEGHPTYIVAELSANHLQSFDRAVELIRASAQAGADAVKLQTYTPATLTLDADSDPFRIKEGTLWAGRRLFDLYAEAQTPWEWHAPLQEVARASGVTLFSSPFDPTAVDFLVGLDMPAVKIASFELVDHGLIAYAASQERPLIMSTGMATVTEIDEAVAVARDAGAVDIALLRCNSAYPAFPDEMDLRTITDMIDRWNVPVGLSDHTLGTTAACVAVAQGACIIEKHVTLDGNENGPDSAFSIDPRELAELVAGVRQAEAMLGGIRYGPSPSEQASLQFRRSLFAVENIEEGERFSAQNVRSIRPAAGLPPKELANVLGGVASRRIPRGTPLSWDLVAQSE